MREILFRGKRLYVGTWVEGAFSRKNYDDPFGSTMDRPSIIKLGKPYDGFWFEVDPATVGQYTGLNDKNGQKIFEGDIWNYKGYNGFIEWCEEESRFVAVYEIDGMQFTNAVSDIRASTVEIIGNIYDNPELLKEGAHE